MTTQGKVYDVTGNKAYQTGGSYNGKTLLSFSGAAANALPNELFLASPCSLGLGSLESTLLAGDCGSSQMPLVLTRSRSIRRQGRLAGPRQNVDESGRCQA